MFPIAASTSRACSAAGVGLRRSKRQVFGPRLPAYPRGASARAGLPRQPHGGADRTGAPLRARDVPADPHRARLVGAGVALLGGGVRHRPVVEALRDAHLEQTLAAAAALALLFAYTRAWEQTLGALAGAGALAGRSRSSGPLRRPPSLLVIARWCIAGRRAALRGRPPPRPPCSSSRGSRGRTHSTGDDVVGLGQGYNLTRAANGEGCGGSAGDVAVPAFQRASTAAARRSPTLQRSQRHRRRTRGTSSSADEHVRRTLELYSDRLATAVPRVCGQRLPSVFLWRRTRTGPARPHRPRPVSRARHVPAARARRRRDRGRDAAARARWGRLPRGLHGRPEHHHMRHRSRCRYAV